MWWGGMHEVLPRAARRTPTKASRHLRPVCRYAPQCYDFKPVVQWFLDRKHGRPQRQGKGGEWRGRLRLALLVAVLAAVLWMLL